MQKFIDKCSIDFYDRQTVDAIDSIKNETIEIEDIVKYWEKAFKDVSVDFLLYFYALEKYNILSVVNVLQETFSFADNKGPSNNQLFATAFHKLAHSGPSLDAILHIEYGYAQAVQDIMSRKSRQIISVTKVYVCNLD